MRTHRGMTLVEILIALTVTAIALSAAMVAVNAQERSYYASHRLRAAQGSARAALLALEQSVPLAGYGMDAPLALDFQWYAPPAAFCPTQLRDGGVCQRDRTDDSDELVFYARNPSYWVSPTGTETAEPRGRAWWIGGISATSVTMKGRPGDVFRRGQILQAVCSGQLRYAYFTLDETQSVPATATGITDVPVALVAVDTNDPFKRQDVAAALPCVVSGIQPTLKVFQIDRYRYHVRPVATGGGRLDPYLVLDTGTDTDGDGDIDLDDELLVAEGIESFQVGYVFSESTLAAVGATQGTGITLADPATTSPGNAANTVVMTAFPGTVATGQFEYEPSSFFKYSLVTLPAQRKTNAQGNIRRVLLSVVARSPEPDPTAPANLVWSSGSTLFRLNQDTRPAWVAAGSDGYQRAFADTSVNLPNMTARTITYF